MISVILSTLSILRGKMLIPLKYRMKARMSEDELEAARRGQAELVRPIFFSSYFLLLKKCSMFEF